jgi:hypothetical protein
MMTHKEAGNYLDRHPGVGSQIGYAVIRRERGRDLWDVLALKWPTIEEARSHLERCAAPKEEPVHDYEYGIIKITMEVMR